MCITQCFVCFHNKRGVTLTLLQPISCGSIDSFSPIFAISNFLISSMPEVTLPIKVPYEELSLKTSHSYNPMYEAWNQLIMTCIVSNSAYRIDDHFYISIPIAETQTFDQLKKRKDKFTQLHTVSKFNEYEHLERVFGIKTEKNKKKVGMYYNQPVPADKIYTPRINACANLLGNLFNNQQWTIFNIPEGQVPTVEELKTYDAILVTGSSNSVLNKSPQVQLAIKNLIHALEITPNMKVVGICYGHQLILQHYGAKIVTKATVGGLQIIHLQASVVEKYPTLGSLRTEKKLALSQCHSDFVETLPHNFQLVAHSHSCSIESTISKDGRIFTTQFHGQVLFPSMKRLYHQRTSFGPTEFCYKLHQPQEHISSNLKDSITMIKVMTSLLS